MRPANHTQNNAMRIQDKLADTSSSLAFVARCAVLALLSMASAHAFAEDKSFSGDVGLGVLRTQPIIRGETSSTGPMPYLAFDYGPLFARIDTFGIKALKAGYGHIEIVARYRGDGYAAAGLAHRANPVPLGIGTLQTTPIGAFEFNITHDFSNSAGTLALVRYIAKLSAGPVTFYPEVGAEMLNARYANYYYGTLGNDASVIGQSYAPGSATNAFIGLLASTHIGEHWTLNGYFRRTKLDEAIARSPLVTRGGRNTLFVAAAREF